MAFALSLTSCSDDNDTVRNVRYTLIFDQLGGDDEVLSEMYSIETAFTEEMNRTLGVTGSYLEITGTIEECDTKVKEACERAAKSLDGTVWSGYFVYVAANVNTGQTIYTLTLGQR
ncbi:MAG: hypothetical protein K2L01_07065 [Rikenellaceae bacterium]|nr:hypothetical protein [Rikenellaceae bacterium]